MYQCARIVSSRSAGAGFPAPCIVLQKTNFQVGRTSRRLQAVWRMKAETWNTGMRCSVRCLFLAAPGVEFVQGRAMLEFCAALYPDACAVGFGVVQHRTMAELCCRCVRAAVLIDRMWSDRDHGRCLPRDMHQCDFSCTTEECVSGSRISTLDVTLYSLS